jgi:hypothetical protein
VARFDAPRGSPGMGFYKGELRLEASGLSTDFIMKMSLNPRFLVGFGERG